MRTRWRRRVALTATAHITGARVGRFVSQHIAAAAAALYIPITQGGGRQRVRRPPRTSVGDPPALQPRQALPVLPPASSHRPNQPRDHPRIHPTPDASPPPFPPGAVKTGA